MGAIKVKDGLFIGDEFSAQVSESIISFLNKIFVVLNVSLL